jgi:hypothetical protein
VAHACNPSYSEGKDQRRIAVQSQWGKHFKKNHITKNWAGGVAQGEGLEFKPQYYKISK